MTDDDDKTRRNLVVFSAGTLASAYLDLPASVLLQQLLGAGNAPAPERLLAVAVTVLGYLLVRYLMSSDGQGSTSLYYQVAKERLLAGYREDAIPLLAARWARNPQQSTVFMFPRNLVPNPEPFVMTSTPKLQGSVGWRKVIYSLEGRFETGEEDVRPVNQEANFQVEVSLDRCYVARTRVLAFTYPFLFHPVGVNAVFPLGLWFAAWCATGYRLVYALS
ncbi:hypothetical protein HK414_12920 [Ramlibacter terrae]|uniref:DUF3592 domain-containing protein n=1 Tax=Ramlibacter terrae TaxID=2732511 RepID=A0ABX6P2P0_9BURK|nr:hypothetical protein HK414_12920 [Ramlibacter terrae]